jgi:hypothetical protein
MSVTAVISIGKAIVPAMPSEAIVTNAGQDYIFVLTSKTLPKQGEAAQETIFYFEKTPVVKGTSDIGFTEIVPVNTIPAGARVVTKGAFFVMAKLTNTGEHE